MRSADDEDPMAGLKRTNTSPPAGPKQQPLLLGQPKSLKSIGSSVTQRSSESKQSSHLTCRSRASDPNKGKLLAANDAKTVKLSGGATPKLGGEGTKSKWVGGEGGGAKESALVMSEAKSGKVKTMKELLPSQATAPSDNIDKVDSLP